MASPIRPSRCNPNSLSLSSCVSVLVKGNTIHNVMPAQTTRPSSHTLLHRSLIQTTRILYLLKLTNPSLSFHPLSHHTSSRYHPMDLALSFQVVPLGKLWSPGHSLCCPRGALHHAKPINPSSALRRSGTAGWKLRLRGQAAQVESPFSLLLPVGLRVFYVHSPVFVFSSSVNIR